MTAASMRRIQPAGSAAPASATTTVIAITITATSGRGLLLVEQLSQSWGVQSPVGSGKDVWFEVPRA